MSHFSGSRNSCNSKLQYEATKFTPAAKQNIGRVTNRRGSVTGNTYRRYFSAVLEEHFPKSEQEEMFTCPSWVTETLMVGQVMIFGSVIRHHSHREWRAEWKKGERVERKKQGADPWAIWSIHIYIVVGVGSAPITLERRRGLEVYVWGRERERVNGSFFCYFKCELRLKNCVLIIRIVGKVCLVSEEDR